MWVPDISSRKKVQYPCFCEIKIDGNFAYWNGEKLLSKWGKELPVITPLPKGVELYGEVYYGEGKEFYSEIHSHQGVDNVFVAFDTGDYGKKPFEVRRNQLTIMKQYLPISEGRYCQTEEEVEEYFNEVVGRGYEGIVCKPLNSLTDKSWVKKKRFFTSTLKVRGIRKGKSVATIAVGTADKVLGCCSLVGWEKIANMIKRENSPIISDDKEIWYIDSDIMVEVQHNGLIFGEKMRHPVIKGSPVIKRIRDYKEEVCI